ncbi:LysR substrate-binding domain-containing protein [Streptomyces sp. NPDC046870]|uniref:LysR substrate-binding domain-containing protein n=1 Tax=Streptomyces sp. NPDC046870 TaxID=3155135 RepID=UPI0034544534
MEEVVSEPFVHYDPENGMGVWIDQFITAWRIDLTVVLRTRSPRTAAQLAGSGMEVTIVPVSALAGRPSAVVRRRETRCTAMASPSRWFPPMRWCAGSSMRWCAGSSPTCGGGCPA